MKYFLLLLLLFNQAYATDCQQESEHCAAIGKWNFSVSLGAGAVTNPLHGGNNIPLVVIPTISYYGENIFFENNTLGYSFFETEQLVVSAIGKLNYEKSYFSRWHPENILVDSSSSNSVISTPDEGDQNTIEPSEDFQKSVVNINEVSDRDWAIDAGIQLNWFINKTTDAKLNILHDINNVYNGFNGQLALTKRVTLVALPSTLMSFSLGANWNSESLVDYYYGISKQRDPKAKVGYQGKQSINPYLRFALKHQLSEHWRVRVQVKRVFLATGTTNSPLVKEDHVNTFFTGVTYDF